MSTELVPPLGTFDFDRGKGLVPIPLIWIISHCIWSDVPRYSYTSFGNRIPQTWKRPCYTFEADKLKSLILFVISNHQALRDVLQRIRALWKQLFWTSNDLKNWFQLRWRAKYTQWQLWTEHLGDTSSNLQSSEHNIPFEWGCTTKERSKSMILRSWASLHRMCDSMPLQRS